MLEDGSDASRPYLVMEYVQGRTLCDVVEELGRLTLVDVVRLGLQVCSVLHYLHQEGLLHMDVKPGNVVLRAELADRRGRVAEWLHFDIAGGRRLDAARLSQFTRELAIMLEAGQDLDRALRFVVENAGNSRAGIILGAVRDRVRGGSSLASALAGEPRSFSRFYVGLVRAGEAGGTLPATLNRLESAPAEALTGAPTSDPIQDPRLPKKVST